MTQVAKRKKTLDTCVIDRRVSPDITSVSIWILYELMLREAWLAQSVEHETLNLRVVGSSPTSSSIFG